MAKDHAQHVGSRIHNVFRNLYSLLELDVLEKLEALVLCSILHPAALTPSDQASLSM
jgi:hypothetical protein